MAYFCAANPETVLEPLVGGKAVEVYKTNGMIIEKGITVGELGRRIMEGIYGSGIEEDNGRKLENERKEVAL